MAKNAAVSETPKTTRKRLSIEEKIERGMQQNMELYADAKESLEIAENDVINATARRDALKATVAKLKAIVDPSGK